MSVRKDTPCNYDGICPYDAEYFNSCEYWCGVDEPEDYDNCDYETGFDPYMGCYTDDC